MRRFPALYQPDTNNDTICEDVRCLASVVCLVLRLADELSFDGLRACNLNGRTAYRIEDGVPRRRVRLRSRDRMKKTERTSLVWWRHSR